MRLLLCLTVLGCVSCFAAIGFGQNTNSGDIRGTVVDPSGAVLPGADVGPAIRRILARQVGQLFG